MASRQCGIYSKPQPLLQKTYLSYASETLAAYIGMCLRMHALARVCKPRPTYAGQGPLWSFYFQKQIFAHLKCYIFHFNTPQVNLIYDWALNWPWALEFEHHWGTGNRVIRSTKCDIYKRLLELRFLQPSQTPSHFLKGLSMFIQSLKDLLCH